MKTQKYLVISNQQLPDSPWEESMQASCGVCRTCKKAYEIALFLAGIHEPCSGYRKVLESLKAKGAYTIRQQGGEQEATIVLIKEYR